MALPAEPHVSPRQVDRRHRPAVHRIAQLHPRADHLGLAECDGQTEARALTALPRAGLEALRAVLEEMLREAGPVVADRDHGPGDPHLDRVRAVPAGVRHEVGDDPLQAARVGAYEDVVRARGDERTPYPDRRTIPSTRPAGGCTSRSGCSTSASSRATSSRSSVRVRRACTRSSTSSVGRPARQQLGRRVQSGQRGAQLVGDIGGEPLLGHQAPLQGRGHRVDRGGQFGDLVSPRPVRPRTSGDRGWPIRASSSPWLMRRAVAAAVRSSRLSLLARPAPPSAASTTTTAPETISCRSNSAISAACSPSGSRTDRTWSPTGRAAQTAGSSAPMSR